MYIQDYYVHVVGVITVFKVLQNDVFELLVHVYYHPLTPAGLRLNYLFLHHRYVLLLRR